MAKLLLQHEVQALEKDLQRKMTIADTQGDRSDQNRATRPAPGGKGIVRRPVEGETLSQMRMQSNDDVTKTARHARHLGLPTTGGNQVIIVDASVLIYSLRSVHEWRKRKDVRLVVPDEGEWCD